MKISKETKQELLLEYYEILENIYTNNYSDKELDNLLLIFSESLSTNSNVSKMHQHNMDKQTMQLIKEMEEKKLKSINEQKENIYNSYIKLSSKDFSSNEIDKLTKEIIQNIENLKDLDIEVQQITAEDKDFKNWIDKLMKKSLNKKEAIEKRLNSHFNDKTISEACKTVDDQFEAPGMEQEIFQSLRNYVTCQSSINRIRSLKNSGASLTESIKTVIPKKKWNEVQKYVNIQKQRSKEFKETQKRLY